ncbi:cytochrome P450, partial [Blastocladiella britannica]
MDKTGQPHLHLNAMSAQPKRKKKKKNKKKKMLTAIATAAAALVLSYYYWLFLNNNNNNNNNKSNVREETDKVKEEHVDDDPTAAQLPLPPAPAGAWPFLGHLPLVAAHAAAPDALFAKLAATHGPVVMLQMGPSSRLLIISAIAPAKEALATRGKHFSSRFPSRAWDRVTEGGRNLVMAPYGAHWRRMRRSAHAILSPGALADMDSVLAREADHLVSRLHALHSSSNTVDAEQLFLHYSVNVIFSTTVGVSFDRSDDPALVRLLATAHELMAVLGAGSVAEYLPGWLVAHPLAQPFLKVLSRGTDKVIDKTLLEITNGFVRDRLLALQTVLAAEDPADREARRSSGGMSYGEELLLRLLHNGGNATSDSDSDQQEQPLTFDEIKLLLVDLMIAGM